MTQTSDISREPALPRPSASVILARDGRAGLETFMVRRHARSPVAPSAFVFPGGTVRADDSHVAELDAADLARSLSQRSDTPLEPAQAATYYVSAVRELFEEAGVLLARDPTGALVSVDESDTTLQERLESTRLALQAHEFSLANVLADWGWRPAFELLVPFSHWVTPRALAARFDTRFFVAEMPPRQAALHDTIETSEGVWLRPIDALEGDYRVVYATAQHLRRLSSFARVADLLAFARQKPIRVVQPDLTESGSGLSVSLRPELIDVW
jgi:8-oxo-dGTP pyrophosphatase MutT (NUDIX family)